MGNYFLKEKEKEMSLVEVNKERVLDVYLNIYSNSSDQLIGARIYQKGDVEEYIGTNAGHFSITIDKNGESDDDQHPVGLEIHLVMKDAINSTETGFKIAERSANSVKLIKTVKVGKALLLNTKEYVESDNFDRENKIRNLFHESFYTFIKEKCGGDKTWGRKNNCHNFAKYCLEKELQLKWPETVQSPCDDYPFLLDILKIQKSASIQTNQTS
ncbi:hypothetical protein ACTFIY_006248 [Dictyostelium cf. discoideum]